MLPERAYLFDIISALEKVLAFSAEMTREKFLVDEKTQAAVIYEFMIVGEVVKRLSPEFRLRYSQINWSEWISFRNVLIHEYGEVDASIVYNTILKEVRPFIELLKEIQETLT